MKYLLMIALLVALPKWEWTCTQWASGTDRYGLGGYCAEYRLNLHPESTDEFY